MARIEPWGNAEITNGHIEGSDEARGSQFFVDNSLMARIRRWWTQGPFLYPCGCPGKDFVPTGRVQYVDFPGISHYAYVPTAGVPQAAIAMQNRATVGQAFPNMATDTYPTGDPLQRQLYDALNGYWEESPVWDS